MPVGLLQAQAHRLPLPICERRLHSQDACIPFVTLARMHDKEVTIGGRSAGTTLLDCWLQHAPLSVGRSVGYWL